MGDYSANPKNPYRVKIPQKIRKRITMGAAAIKEERKK